MIEKLLKIGLNKTEAEIYLVLLENSKLTPASISRITGINRTTVYAAVSELVIKGIVEEDLSGKTKYFIAQSADQLALYTKKQFQEVKERQLVIEELIPELELIPKSKSFSIPKIQVIHKNDIEEFLYKKSPIWNQNMSDIKEMTWWGFQDHQFVENDVYKKWILWYWKNSHKDIDLKLFTNQSKIEKEMKNFDLTRRELKSWKGNKFTSTQWILGEYIISIVIQEKNHYLVQIRDRVLADSMRNLAKDLWSKS